MKKKFRFVDLFAGAGGLSEGFIRAGFIPIAHVEMSKAACFTLQTRMAFHWLKAHDSLEIYKKYLYRKISRKELYNAVPKKILHSVINMEICEQNLAFFFDAVDILAEKKHIDIIIGGPPCQAYSIIGRSRDNNRMRGDIRNYLYIYYAEILKRYQPKYFLFENVLGLLSARENGEYYLNQMYDLFQNIGYQTEYRILSTENYGILQNRKRIILVGKRGVKQPCFPDPVPWNPMVTVGEIFSDLPFLSAGSGSPEPCCLKKYYGRYLYEAGIRNDDVPVTLHWSRPHTQNDLEIYRIAVKKWNKQKERLNYNDLPENLKNHKNRNSFLDRFKVVAADLPFSHTVVAHIARDGHYYIHPDILQNRSLTPREAARLQTFPDDYYFENNTEIPSRTSAYRQIGNAVPVLLAQKIAEKLKEIW